MNNLWLIFKTSVFNTFGLNKILKKTKEGKLSIYFGIIVLIGVILSYAFSFFYLLIFGDIVYNEGSPELILLIGISSGLIILFFTNIMKANGYIFRTKDFDLLMSLPIKSSVIVTSKIVFLLFVNYVILSFVYFPALAVFAIYNDTSVLFWILSILIFFFIPLLPISLSGFISYGLGFLTVNLKHKNFFSIVSTLLAIVFFMYLSFKAQIMEDNPSYFVLLLDYYFGKIYPAPFAFEGILGNFFQLILFFIISIVPFIIFIAFVSRNYLKANSRSRNISLNKNFVMKELKATHQLKALMNKETSRFFNSPIYVINSIIGPVLSALGFTALIILKNQTPLEEIPGYNPSSLSLLLVGFMILSLGITSTTSCSISIEGKQFWILKSIPIHIRYIFYAKIFVNLLITIPFIIYNTLIAIFVIRISFSDAFFMLMIPTVFVLYMSHLGLYINLLLPRFDYDSDTKAVKQSMSVLVTLTLSFVSLILIVIFGIIGSELFISVAGTLMIVMFGILLMLAFIVFLTYTHGIKLFNKLHG